MTTPVGGSIRGRRDGRSPAAPHPAGHRRRAARPALLAGLRWSAVALFWLLLLPPLLDVR
ncbi:hypothetical protein [Microtetraspora niveoalba]|uniref:hypothetical protein n=1 Tax=Microtetraspora niveoalba TaxID=46175 RepID=UPI00082F1ECE|nr:hypothetical protein [Microtetraspora niveoalba]